MLYFLDLFGTFVFSISGVWLACRKGMDLFGAMVLAFVTAVGGGTIRDVLLASTPVFWIQDTHYLLVVLLTTLFAIVFRQWHARSHLILQISDAFGLSVFVVIGVTKSLSFNCTPLAAIMMGVLTGCGGGAIRDLLAGEVPMVLKKEIYASAAMVGGVVLVFLQPWINNVDIACAIAAMAVLALRLLAIYKKLSLPCFGLPPARF